MSKIKAISFERYYGGIAIKRRYGGQGTVTKFYVYEESNPGDTTIIQGFGATPSERKTYAINAYKLAKSLK